MPCRAVNFHYRTRMRLTLDNLDATNVVTRLGPEGVQVGNTLLTRSAVFNAATLVTDWPVTDANTLDMDALAPALALEPEILVLGTGSRILFPGPELYAALAERGIGLEVMDTASACRTYNVLAGEGRPVVAALILP